MLKLVTYRTAKNFCYRVGMEIVEDNAPSIMDIAEYTNENVDDFIKPPTTWNYSAANNMISVIQSGDDTARWLKEVSNRVSKKPESLQSKGLLTPLSEVTLAAPIPVPLRNVMCIGKNYKDHVAEVAAADKDRGIGSTSASTPAGDTPKYPQFFTKATGTVVGPGANVLAHANLTKWLDYEAELAVIIGKQGKDISRDRAWEYIFGYTIANDVTSRDIQRHHGQWFKGKSLDTTCPLGPAIVHRFSDNFDPTNLAIKCWINGEKRQESNTGNMIFDIPEIIQQLSAGFTLYPGDIILTGTPQGVGYAMKPPKLLQAGDHMSVEIENIGKLENRVV
jgi:2-keto-4-pentenoate hydratase/2-oxohepta-3-ene-1,7-dioic acid hydratase in catechol pathway